MTILHKNIKKKHDHINHEKLHFLALFFLILIFLFFYFFKSSFVLDLLETNNQNNLQNFYNIYKSSLSKKDLEESREKLKMEYKKENSNKNIFENLNILAKSYIIYDFTEKKIIFAKNENQVLPLASLTKIVSAFTAFKLDDNKNQDIIIKKKFLERDEKLDIGLKEGQKWKLDEILKYTLITSSNAAITNIAKEVSLDLKSFTLAMNTFVKNLGFKNFNFTNASGLDNKKIFGGQGTAFEYAELFGKIYFKIPEILSYTTKEEIKLNSKNYNINQILNTNHETDKFLNLLASKTGYTDEAGGNLAIIFNVNINKPIVIVVLNSTKEGRFSDVYKLYEATQEYFK